jgi:hypothetical protein
VSANGLREALQAYLDICAANGTGYTLEQVRTLNRLERDHERAIAGLDPYFVSRFPFIVEHDARIGLPRVGWLDSEHGHPYFAAVLATGEINYSI